MSDRAFKEIVQNDIFNEWMNSEETARYLSISTGVLRNLTSQGKIPYSKLGRSNRYNRKMLDRLLMKNMLGVENDH